jgi:hypothetical protein
MICPELICAEWRSRLIELSRGRLFDVQERDRMLSHLSICAPCNLLFEEQTALTSAETALAAGMAVVSPPPELESILLAEYVSHARFRRRRFPTRKSVVITGAIAATVLCGWLVRPRLAPQTQPAATAPTAVAAALPEVDLPEIALPEVALPPPPKPLVRKVHRKSVPLAQPADAAGQFVAIPYTVPLDPRERAIVVRMEMPVAALAAVGLNVAAPDSSATAHADVVVGEDGRMRAIRLLSISDSNPDRSIHQ